MASTILSSLTLIILAVSIFIGMKNKTMYEERIQTRIAEDDKNVKKTNKLKQTRAEQKDTEEKKIAREGEAVEMGKKLDEQKQKNDELAKQIDEKKDQIAAQKAKIEQLEEALKELGDIEELIPKVKVLKNSIVQLRADIEANNAKLSGLIAEQNRTTAIAASYEKENAWRSSAMSNPQLNTRIGRIYDSYGFVSLVAGNTLGVVGGSTLEVVRDRVVIAKLLVKAVEANTSTAEIIPGTLLADTVLMEGDKVRSVAVSNPAQAPAQLPVVALPQDMSPEEDAPAEASPMKEESLDATPSDAIFE